MVNMAISMIGLCFLFSLYLFERSAAQNLVTKSIKPEPAIEYCSFFNNRAPQAQPGLKNCTWFKHNSCCQQQEIEATFGVVKPLQGASIQCQNYINYLMCYICAPNQNIFYQKERLTVCERFCNSFYEACLGAILKGDNIMDLYPNGREFCISRRFLVGNTNCFDFDIALDTKTSSSHNVFDWRLAAFLPTIVLFYYLLTALGKLRFLESLYDHVKIISEETGNGSEMSRRDVSCEALKNKRILILVAMLIGTVGGSAAEQDVAVLDVISGSEIRDWAQMLSRDLKKLSNDGMAFDTLQRLVGEIRYEKAKITQEDELNKLKESLEKYFDDKKRLAHATAAEVTKFYDEFASRQDSRLDEDDDDHDDYKSVDDLPSSVYLDANRLYSYQLNESRTYSSFLRQSVVWGQSVVKLPDSINRKNKDVIEAIRWTTGLDKIFKEARKTSPEIRWQYFGSNTGALRLYPGLEWKKDFVGFPEDFEPRMQSWYVDLKSGTRNIVLIVDSSASMKLHSLERAKTVASILLGSLNHNHNLAVIRSSSSVWDTDGEVVSGSVEVLGCHGDRLFPATPQHREGLTVAVQQLQAKGGSDHLPAFRKAFDLLRLQQQQDEAGRDCGSMIIFITDGKLDEQDLRCTPGFHKYSEDNRKSFHPGEICRYDTQLLLNIVSLMQLALPGSKASIFTFVTSVSSRADLWFPGSLACQNNGVMSKILKDDTESSFFDQMEAYFKFVETTKLSTDPLVTGVYLSPIDDVATLTFSSSVISNITKKRIGAVGIDIALSDIEDLLKSSSASNGQIFLMNLIDGTAIVHPLAKRSYELEDFLPHVSVAELETENGVPEDFSIVLEEMKSGQTGNYKITKNASTAFVLKELLIRKSVKSVHYFYAPIAGTNFGIAIKYTDEDDANVVGNLDGVDSVKSYYHGLISSSNSDLNEERKELQISTASTTFYKGSNVSFQHSVVAFSPDAFCKLSNYYEQFGSSLPAIQDALNQDASETESCMLTPAARRDSTITSSMEPHWLNLNLSVLASTYVATPSGMMRVYPGVVVPNAVQHSMNRDSWYTRAIINGGKVTVSPPHRGHHVPDAVVTLSQAVFNGTDCSSSPASCNFNKVFGVAGVDVGEVEFQSIVHSSLMSTENSGRSCRDRHEKYPCIRNSDVTCQTLCYLINDNGEVVYGLPRRRRAYLSELYSYVFNILRERRIFVPRKSMGYQATCLDTGEVLNPENSAESSQHVFEMRHSCVEQTDYYQINQSRLAVNFHGVFSHDLDDDPCHEGIFFMSPINGTDVFLLVFDELQDLSANPLNKGCQTLQKSSVPMTRRTERRSCTENTTAYNWSRFGDPCHRAQSIVLPCGYSTAAAVRSFVFLSLCFLLTLVFLI